MFLNLLNVFNDPSRRVDILSKRYVFILSIDCSLMPPTTMQAQYVKCPLPWKAKEIYLIYVKSIPAHDWREATLATATSQLKAYAIHV